MLRGMVIALVVLIWTAPASAATISPIGGGLESVPADGYVLMVGEKTFTNADLEDFWLYQTTMETEWGPKGVFVGPKLNDVLSAAGICACGALTMKAANGDSVKVTHLTKGFYDALVVTRINGELLQLDGFGPFWVVWPTMNDAVRTGSDHAEYWIRGLVEISEED